MRDRAWEACDSHANARRAAPTTSEGPEVPDPRSGEGGVHELVRFASQRTRSAATVGFDITFSAPKSVSVLWAVSAPDVEGQILDTLEAAVAAGLRALEQQAIACRVRGRVTQGDGLLAAGFLHATHRNLDP